MSDWLARRATRTDRAAVASWLTAVVALLAKESAAVIGPISALIAFRIALALQCGDRKSLLREFLQRRAAFVAIFVKYEV